MAEHTREFQFELTGGRLCLDFANTLDNRRALQPQERLNRYADLVAWSRQTGVLRQAEAHRLLREAARCPRAALAVIEAAIELREAIFEIFAAAVAGKKPSATSLARLNEHVARALGRLRLAPAKNGYAWSWAAEFGGLGRMLWPVARSAAELLTSPELSAVRECAAEECGWLFLDRSKNRSRRWCDMKVCGNRSKVRRYYQRTRARQ